MLVNVVCRWVDYPGDFAEILDDEKIRREKETYHDSVYRDFDDIKVIIPMFNKLFLANGDSG